MSRLYELWTDGGAWPNPGVGGWAFVLIAPCGEELRDSGSEPETTNNRMEMRAIVEGLTRVPDGEGVTVYSDSTLMVSGTAHWAEGWRRRGWCKSGGVPVKNGDLWEEILAEKERIGSVYMELVKGHSGVERNDEVDLMATEARLGVADG